MRIKMFEDLPYELLYQVLTSLPVLDVANLLSSSKTLYSYHLDESIWKHFCFPYDESTLQKYLESPEITYFSIYTGLLHRYGPLLGLWASDHPYKGNIIEFRYASEGEGWKGIIGESWKFETTAPENDLMMADFPTLPQYYQFLRIEIVESSPSNSTSPSKPVETKAFRVDWFDNPERGDEVEIDKRRLVYFIPPTRFSVCLRNWVIEPGPPQTYRPIDSVHPPFPSTQCREIWCDTERPVPENVPIIQYDPLDNSNLRTRSVFLFMKRGNVPSSPDSENTTTPSWAITFPPRIFERRDWMDILAPDIYIPDYRNFKVSRDSEWPRERFSEQDTNQFVRDGYYPLRYPIRRPLISLVVEEDPVQDSELVISNVEGLWLGAYSLHGTEVIYISPNSKQDSPSTTSFSEDSGSAEMNQNRGGVVQAWKITGDENVPRGVMSWKFFTDTLEYSQTRGTIANEVSRKFGNIPEKTKLYRGVGYISGHGYSPTMRDTTPVHIAIISLDHIKIHWDRLECTSNYRRYPGRNIDSEQPSIVGKMRFSREWD